MMELRAYKSAIDGQHELGWHFQSLLDACYLMLLLDCVGGRKLIECRWCKRLTRLRPNSPHNAAYCPPQGSSAGSCADKATKWKYRQRQLWNDHLRERYGNVRDLATAWGLKSQEGPRKWGKVPHPSDLRQRGILPPAAREDYMRWRASLSDDPRHGRVVDDKVILADAE
jgi:hypothetical protein